MAQPRRTLYSLIGLVGLVWLTPTLAQPPAAEKKDDKKPAASKFLRIQRDVKEQPVALETAIVRYKPAAGEGELVVDLVSVVHIGDAAYYEKLNKQFEQYDVVLFELVAPRGTQIPKGGKRDTDNPLAMMQQMMKTVLDLESQTEHIDYTRKNFVHADLSPEEMMAAIRNRGDDGITLALSVMADLLRKQNLLDMEKQANPKKAQPELDPLALLLDPDAGIKMKRLLAEQLAELDSPEGGLGETINTILITDRNKAAMKVFQKEVAKGKKKIAIFYGAGHMPDFEKRLKEDFGLKRDGEQWLTAWDLKAGKKRNPLEDLLKQLGR